MYQTITPSSSVVTLVADALSLLAILSCMFCKVPQIMNIKRRRSSEGINLQGLVMEIFGYTITALYNYTNGFKISTYLEYPIIIFQLHIMLYFVLKYRNQLTDAITILLLTYYWFIVGFFIFDVLSKDYLSYLVPLCLPISGFAKLSYILDIINLGNADAVSIITWVISTLTNLVRVFTVYVDSADIKLLINFSISSLLSLSVLVTAVCYQWTIEPNLTQRQLQSRIKRRIKKSN